MMAVPPVSLLTCMRECDCKIGISPHRGTVSGILHCPCRIPAPCACSQGCDGNARLWHFL
eukprot:scaffold334_cov356-Prasinococcus_capsulatus_cf.AAC.3